ncbi:helix-turn-helix domain-containing protein (plasmid) [Serratia ureilytica]|uniref:helix-turn-helix domain-containing protein n=1 Tax=Serratia ureilytica TaxID=300181 RepID=UPI001CBC4206|nr:helix-turn-helix domain-containing protein [Serratia ureilytica]UAN29729.1 helix-turn-helix domain-containing protein [Serratia ureilytica]
MKSIDVSNGFLAEIITKSKYAKKIVFKKNRMIDLNIKGESSILLLENGSASVYYEPQDVLIFTVKAPCIIGLTQIFSGYVSNDLIVKFETDSITRVIKNSDAIKVFTESDCWYHVSVLLEDIANIYYQRYSLSSSPDVFGIIKSHIEYIWSLPESERENISIIDYILKRNKVSRSSIYRIIKDLNNGGYIKTERGKLKHFNFIPDFY